MDALEEAAQSSKDTLSEGAKALKAGRNRAYRLAKTSSQKLSFSMKLVTVFILSATAVDESALTCLRNHCRSPLSRGIVFDFAIEDLHGWMGTAHADVDYKRAESNPDHSIALRAYKHIGEFFAYKDVHAASANGVPVSSREIVAKYKFHVPATGRGPKMLKHLASLLKKEKKEAWLRKFRSKWAVEYKKIKPRLHVAFSKKKKKARSKPFSTEFGSGCWWNNRAKVSTIFFAEYYKEFN